MFLFSFSLDSHLCILNTSCVPWCALSKVQLIYYLLLPIKDIVLGSTPEIPKGENNKNHEVCAILQFILLTQIKTNGLKSFPFAWVGPKGLELVASFLQILDVVAFDHRTVLGGISQGLVLRSYQFLHEFGMQSCLFLR